MAVDALAARVRSGPGYWLDSYRATLRWQLSSLRLILPTTAAIQVLAGVGFLLGFELFFSGPMPVRNVVFMATGITVINLYMLGLIICPQYIGQQKMAKTFEFTQSMPVPRAVGFATWYTINLLVGTPALVVSLVAAYLLYHVPFAISPAAIPAVMLVSLCSLAIGYALGNAVSQPMITQVLTQVLNFGAIGFAPVTMPPEQLPVWLQTVNHMLPFEGMATVVRSGFTAGSDNLLAAYATLGAWTAICLSIAAWSVMRRG